MKTFLPLYNVSNYLGLETLSNARQLQMTYNLLKHMYDEKTGSEWNV